MSGSGNGTVATVTGALVKLVPLRLPLALGGVLLGVVGSVAPWTTSGGIRNVTTGDFYPGVLSKSLFAAGLPNAGHRIFTLLLSFVAFVAITGIARRARIVRLSGLGLLAVSTLNFVIPAIWAGGLGRHAVGGALSIVAGLLLTAAGFADTRDEPRPRQGGPRPWWVEAVLLIMHLAGILALVVWVARIEGSYFVVSFAITVVVAVMVLRASGWLDTISGIMARRRPLTAVLIALAALTFPFTQGGEIYWIRVAANVLIFAAVCIGLNIVVGLAGLLDLGYVAFFGVGAYAAAIFSGAQSAPFSGVQLPLLLALLVGMTATGVFGVAIGAPTLRLRGDYLAIVTLGFGEIFFVAIRNNLFGLTNGANGINGIPDVELFGYNFGTDRKLFGQTWPAFANYYVLEIVILGLVILLFSRLNDSKVGRAWVAIREDETAAQAMGVNTFRTRLLAFALGAMFSGVAGGLYAHLATSVSNEDYTFNQSVLLLSAVVLGGMGTISGPVLGALLLIALPEKLREFQDYRLMFFAAALILIMRFRPEGLIPSSRRKHEFHAAEEESVLASGTAVQS
jgi:branched-chain amino acid transport system permease protein